MPNSQPRQQSKSGHQHQQQAHAVADRRQLSTGVALACASIGGMESGSSEGHHDQEDAKNVDNFINGVGNHRILQGEGQGRARLKPGIEGPSHASVCRAAPVAQQIEAVSLAVKRRSGFPDRHPADP